MTLMALYCIAYFGTFFAEIMQNSAIFSIALKRKLHYLCYIQKVYKGATTIHSCSFPLTKLIKSNNLAAIIIWSTSQLPRLNISGTA